MTISVTITIHADANHTMTDLETNILNALSSKVTPIASETKKESKTVVEVEDVPAPKKDKPTVQAELPEASEDGEATLDNAVKLATNMVAEGKAGVVKEALATAGVKRVSELKGKAIAVFLEALNG